MAPERHDGTVCGAQIIHFIAIMLLLFKLYFGHTPLSSYDNRSTYSTKFKVTVAKKTRK